MANPTSAIDFDVRWAAFLATSVSGGTYTDIVIDTKVDASAVTATGIESYAGQLWGNLQDDYLRATYAFFEGRKTGPDAVQRATVPTGSPFNWYDVEVPTDDTAVHFKARIYLADPASAANVWFQDLEVVLVNNGGTVTPNYISTAATTMGTWTVTPGHIVSGTSLALRVTHNAAGVAYLDMHIEVEKQIRKVAI